ncbi:MAG: subtilisin-like serine protease [Acidobacteria bacterium OLB17]|nr:MAG: subtilisin-like serine protease [Acidobacteria bacterium OLB17]MCZ2391167.1 S8 family serine peptidase [Acidobacteriota bacterium]
MDRSNIWIHIGLAVVLVSFAAVLGRIDRMASSLRTDHKREIERLSPAPGIPPAKAAAAAPEVLVRFKRGTTLERIRDIAFKNNDRVYDEIEAVNGLVAIDDLDDADAAEVARQYAAFENVEYAEPNVSIRLDDPIQKDTPRDLVFRSDSGQPNDPNFPEQWALNNLGQNGGTERADIDALRAWQASKGSEDVVVAVLDSGVDYRHSDLAENIWTRPASVPEYFDDERGRMDDLHGFDGTSAAVSDNDVETRISDPMDDNGHGTHCAGIIGAVGNNGIGITGVNWNVRIMPLKFLGSGGSGSTDKAIEAINYAIERKKAGVNVRVISASWGSTTRSQALEDTIRAAGDAGILFVAAAGNDGSNTDVWPHYPSSYKLPNLISVAAVDRNDALASFSNFGAKTVDLAAPGKDILSTWLGDDYREASGTSMATPFVSGVAALIISQTPNITVKQLRKKLLDSVDKSDALKGKVASGGTLCAANALGIED